MPAAVAKGIIISISIIAALSIAVLENPQVQSWLDEQRRKITELLRSVGQDLDPESRRRAEAFAFEGRTSANEQTQRDTASDLDAVANATGRSMSNASTIRRIPIKGPSDPEAAEERQRKGREYLAKRSQQMIELQERRKAGQLSKSETLVSPSASTSFDALVDSSGNLKGSSSAEVELSPIAASQTIPAHVKQEMQEVERHLQHPILLSESNTSDTSGWHMESEMADPFGDEYALDRSITPRPASPRQSSTERVPSPEIAVPGSFEQPRQQQQAVEGRTDAEGFLTYEEQLAIAMSLSEQESLANAATVRQRSSKEDADLRRAIQASLKDLDEQQATHTAPRLEAAQADSSPLVEFASSSNPVSDAQPHDWPGFFGANSGPFQALASRSGPSAPRSEATDELYSLTPKLTRARLASLDPWHGASMPALADQAQASAHSQEASGASRMDFDEPAASFFSAASVISHPSRASTLPAESTQDVPQLIDLTEDSPQEDTRTPISRTISPVGFQSDLKSETLEPVSPPASRALSRTPSDVSAVEIVEIEDDTDVDMLSEEGDGIATPDSWSEVGSRDADSEAEATSSSHRA